MKNWKQYTMRVESSEEGEDILTHMENISFHPVWLK